MKYKINILSVLFAIFCVCSVYSQTEPKDAVLFKKNKTDSLLKDSSKSVIKLHSPKRATRRSAILPGWGQAYNKQYWKIPIVYGALAIPAATYVFNDNFYKKTKFAYDAVYAASQGDNSLLPLIDPEVKQPNGNPLSLSTYATARNAYRRNRDYSILYFLLMWGLNVVDATVSGHLKNFDVNSDLTYQIKPMLSSPIQGGAGISFTVSIQPQKHKPSALLEGR